MKLSSAWYWSKVCGLLAIVPTQTAAQAQGPTLPQPESMTWHLEDNLTLLQQLGVVPLKK